MNVRHLLRDALGRLRIQNIQVFGHMEDVRKAFQAGNPDLLIADATSPDSETFKLVQSVRHSVVGGNPFLGIIITAFHPTTALLTKVTNCGADALLVKPVAFRQIQDRINGLIEQPRNFVVTSDFIGPDRRKSPRESSQIPLLEVPNTLRMKATSSLAKLNSHALIERSIRDINEHKLLRQAFQAAFLIEFAVPALSEGKADRMAQDHLQRVGPVLEDIVRRLPTPIAGSRARVPDQAHSLIDAVEIARSQVLSGRAPAEIDRLKEAALEIMQALNPDKDPTSLAREVAAAASAYRARLTAMAEAKAAAPVTVNISR